MAYFANQDEPQSSNAFASGANQNSGNVITGRPSTRVNAHGQSSGGGVSQWSIGGFGGEPASTTQSSNSFASGSNQNSGNVLTGRSSTRVVREPGGASQWSIGGYGDEPASTTQSSNSFASGSNQNSGNVLTERASTRVVREPGGGSQWSVAGFSQEPSVMEIGQKAAPSPSNASAPLADFVATSGDYGQHAFGARVSNGGSNAYANGASQNVGNYITDKPTTRVRQAPGGTSQIVFG